VMFILFGQPESCALITTCLLLLGADSGYSRCLGM
jgi:hypothetical protein